MNPLVFGVDVPATWIRPEYAPVLFAGLVLAGVGTISLFCIGLVAYRRRPTTQYLLITVALGALVARTVVGWGTAFGMVPMTVHHVVEHGLDFFVAVVVLYAVYRKGSPRSTGS
jgi:hypothetical protein